MLTGGLFVLLMGPVDALDGTMARLRGEASDFGAFVDLVTDRYSELIIYGGLLYYFLNTGDTIGGLLVFVAAAGSVLVSYVKARAEGLGYEAKVGLLSVLNGILFLLQPCFSASFMLVLELLLSLQTSQLYNVFCMSAKMRIQR